MTEAARARLVEVANRYFDAVDAEDWDTLGEVLHPEVELTACGSGSRSGSPAVLAMFRKIFQRFPVHSDRPTRFVVEGNTVVVEIHFEGKSATGVEVAFDAVDVFDIAHGRIVRLTQWLDSADLQRRLAEGAEGAAAAASNPATPTQASERGGQGGQGGGVKASS